MQYVKICNLYGDGFYYLPGTDICVKIGGYVRMETAYQGHNNSGGGGQTNWGPFSGSLAGASNTRTDGNDWFIRARAYISMDTRQQTEYGVLRTYINIGINGDSPTSYAGTATNFNGNRAFVQFAGFTVGLAQSFYDFYSNPATSFWGTPASDTGDGGWLVAAYTQNWGNGMTSTLSLERPRRAAVVNTTFATDPFLLAVVPNNASQTATNLTTIKQRFPDIVSAWRIDQAWGGAQIMAAAHDASAGYYDGSIAAPGTAIAAPSAAAANALANATGCPFGTVTGSEVCGHPADKVGWAVGAGFRINNITPTGSYFQFQANYTKGAVGYVMVTQSATSPATFSGGTLGYGWMTDGVYSNADRRCQAHDRLGHQRGLRSPLDQAVEDVGLRLLRPVRVRYRGGQRDLHSPGSVRRCRRHWRTAAERRCGSPHRRPHPGHHQLLQQLGLVYAGLADAVQLHAGLLCRLGCGVHEAADGLPRWSGVLHRRRGRRKADQLLSDYKPEQLDVPGSLPPRHSPMIA